jgi:hypothetical protein
MILPSTPLGLSPRLERFQAHSKDPPRGACGNVRRGFPKSRPTAADDPEQRSGVAVFPQVLPIVSGRTTYVIRANSLFTYAQKPRTETEEKACSSERAKEADR